MNALSLFNDWLNNDYYGDTSRVFVPNVDVTETKDSYVLEMDLPGRAEKDVAIELNDRVLTIASAEDKKSETKETAENQAEKNEAEQNEEAEKPQFLLRERCRSSFSRSFTLPKDIDETGVGASFKNGVLTITIPRKAEAQPRRITINVA
ncbi:MAG: Hsp20/alpha crystallin family protein [Treponema sp.]|nr:Hsp20/alpha crystallin family protein [Treponema sp.]MCR5124738.1 Hsp20/alpha crystallin family protein [Treponema sp.]